MIATADTPNKAITLAKQKLPSGYASKWKHTKTSNLTIGELLKRGKNQGVKIRPDWDQVKDEVMLRANRAKYQQNKKLAKLLISTGNYQLKEHSKDKYWGDGGDGSGLNQLGKMLMLIRNEIR